MLALGIVSGRRREEILEHLEGCPSCGAELERLSMVADSLLELAPEVEPPLGFELRLAERLHADFALSRRRSRRRVLVAALAAAVLVALGFGLGAIANQAAAPKPSLASQPLEARLTSRGHAIGDVILSAGTTPWVMMTIESGPWTGSVTCEVVLANGEVDTVGTFRLSSGYGVWGEPLSAPRDDVRSARLVSSTGAVLARADFRS